MVEQPVPLSPNSVEVLSYLGSEIGTERVARLGLAALISQSHSDNSQLGYQGAIGFVPAAMAFGSLDGPPPPSDNRSYGKNKASAIAYSRHSVSASVHSCSCRLRRRFGWIEYSNAAAINDRGSGRLAIDADFRQRCGGQ